MRVTVAVVAESDSVSPAIRALEALIGADDETAEGFLLASVYCRALRTGEAPRSIVEGLFKAVPSTEAWPPLRDGLLAALDR